MSFPRPLVVRRTLVFRMIMSPISAPCRARESVAAVRKILVASLESSHRWYNVVLVFAGAKMCGHISLIRSAYAKKPVK